MSATTQIDERRVQGPTPLVIGVDEAGRGPLAGPVVAAAVLLGDPCPQGLDDSKKLSGKRRAVLETAIRQTCRWAVGVVEVDWDGRNESGQLCAPGVYRAWLVAPGTRQAVAVARVP